MRGRANTHSQWLLGCFGALTILVAGPLAVEHNSSALARGPGELLAGSSAASRWGVLDRGRITRAGAATGSAPMAGQVFGQCFYSVSPTSVSNVSADGASGSITVSWHYEPNSEFPDEEDASVCEDNWGTSSQATWISVRESETDNDVANYRVSANISTATRSGTITVAGESITISQDAAPDSTPRCVFTVSPTKREVADDAGQYDVTVTASNASCSWSMSSNTSWITVLTPSRTGSTTGTYRTASNATPGSPLRTGTMTVAGHTVTITQRRGRDPDPDLGKSNVCETWHSFDHSARSVFIWNTHRLHRSGLLQEVAGMVAMFGTDRAQSCGGAEYNRTYMLMEESLQDKFLVEARTRGEGPLREWRHTMDPHGPHDPYMFSIETHSDRPRGQIHFFHRDWVEVRRKFNDVCEDVFWHVERTTAERMQGWL